MIIIILTYSTLANYISILADYMPRLLISSKGYINDIVVWNQIIRCQRYGINISENKTGGK